LIADGKDREHHKAELPDCLIPVDYQWNGDCVSKIFGGSCTSLDSDAELSLLIIKFMIKHQNLNKKLQYPYGQLRIIIVFDKWSG
jgi:hypothetical protein